MFCLFVCLQGALQQLMIVPDATLVNRYCTDFTPNCDTPLLYAPFLPVRAANGDVVQINNVRYVSAKFAVKIRISAPLPCHIPISAP